MSPLTLRQQVAAITTAALSGFILGAGAYVLLEFAFLWGVSR